MSGKSVLVDTNVLIYLLKGDKTAAHLLLDKDIYISFVSQIELLSGKNLSAKEISAIENLISLSQVVESNPRINKKAAELRKRFNFKLPDALILATSFVGGVPLVTADYELMKSSEIQIIKYSHDEV